MERLLRTQPKSGARMTDESVGQPRSDEAANERGLWEAPLVSRATASLTVAEM